MSKASGCSREEIPRDVRLGAEAEGRYPASKARGGGREEGTQVQGAVAVLVVQEGREELLHVQGQEGRL